MLTIDKTGYSGPATLGPLSLEVLCNKPKRIFEWSCDDSYKVWDPSADKSHWTEY